MRTWLIALSLTLCSCVSLAPDTVQTDGALGRQVARVIERHDSYVLGDEALTQAQADAALADSAALELLVGLPEVSRSALRGALAPVAARHDSYVRADASLEADERAQYLATTDVLRRLAGSE